MPTLVTGATGGVGQAVCAHLAARGEDLILTSRDLMKLAAAKTIYERKYKIAVSVYAGDFSKPETICDLVAALKNAAPKINGMVLIYPGIEKPSGAFPSAQVWLRNWSTCFIQPLELLGCAAQLMVPGGKIVVVSGIASSQVFPHLALSNPIRSAWLAQVKTLSFALASSDLRINTVSLGCILTDRIQEKLERAGHKTDPMSVIIQEDKVSALQHHGQPEQAAATICGMLTLFADHITGQNILCDGGYTRHY